METLVKTEIGTSTVSDFIGSKITKADKVKLAIMKIRNGIVAVK